MRNQVGMAAQRPRARPPQSETALPSKAGLQDTPQTGLLAALLGPQIQDMSSDMQPFLRAAMTLLGWDARTSRA